MRKAINFDIDTKKYEAYTGKDASTAYNEIENFLIKNGFEHRQGSGYISNTSITDRKVADILTKMSSDISWLRHCVNEMDLTNIGKIHSVIGILKDAPTISQNLMLKPVNKKVDLQSRKTEEWER